ncbi:5-oxoprolinase subunit PxpB [Paenibacillus sp. N3.4]|uniref:5-oxoprolinase subunit PxpB n=1 Tax=Paenibacillus sp. N3.4 TaxID=2603222 RepID=UPI0011CA1DB5|nr:5-oxoprolinase subunit PxpB [Paenibacillus sp. N3.4]TXK85631.1 5-oxoprolinase subunit PxpB [Paenibacillus sp. N3.4]
MTKLAYQCHSLGDSALVIRLGTSIDYVTLNRVRQLTAFLEKHKFAGFVEIVAAYMTITIYYDCFTVYQSGTSRDVLLPYEMVRLHIQTAIADFEKEMKNERDEAVRAVDIPVCYGGIYGPDLEEVAAYHGVSSDEIVRRHTAQEYPVYLIGFAPGFPYLGGLDKRLETPRKAIPRTKISAGSVGIGGAQTGIYPLETPGGWNLIGRTPVVLFQPHADIPSLLKVGDLVRFVAITPEQFDFAAERNSEYGL